MERPKKVKLPSLLLVLLFTLAQATFIFSATLSYGGLPGNVQGQNIQNDLNLEIEQSQIDDLENAEEEDIHIASIDHLDSLQIHQAAAEIDFGMSKELFDSKIAIQDNNSTMLLYTKNQVAQEVEPLAVEPLAVKTLAVEPVAEEPTPQPVIKSVVKHVNADTLNVRSEPTSQSDLVTSIHRGDKVTYYETTGDWARITTWTDRKGYILAKHLVDSADKVERVVVQEPKEQEKIVASRGEEKTDANLISAEGLSLADEIIEYAKTLLGVPYRWSGYSTSGFDCSGFTKYVFAKFGISVPRSSYSYSGIGTKVSRSELQKGDILLWDSSNNGRIGHVGIYIGDGMFIHASSSKGKVVTRSVSSYSEKYMGARRVIK